MSWELYGTLEQQRAGGPSNSFSSLGKSFLLLLIFLFLLLSMNQEIFLSLLSVELHFGLQGLQNCGIKQKLILSCSENLAPSITK